MAENKSIITIIQKMVEDNEPDDKIIGTLQSMGVTLEQAKRLLLIAQADTFTLLGAEIDKIVSQRVSVQKENMQRESTDFINTTLEMKKRDIKSEMEKEILGYKNELFDSQKKFQLGINDSISKIAKLNEQSYTMSEENKKMIEIINKDLTETKLKGIKLRRSLTRNILVLFGILSFATTAGLLAASIVGTFNLDYVTTGIVFSLIGTALIYLSANI